MNNHQNKKITTNIYNECCTPMMTIKNYFESCEKIKYTYFYIHQKKSRYNMVHSKNNCLGKSLGRVNNVVIRTTNMLWK